MASVRYAGVTKRYTPDSLAVDQLDLEIGDQEFMVLVGPSGCGKSTALRMLAGLESISDGEIWLGDERINDVAPEHRDLAMVFQSYALYPHMTVAQNLGFGLKMRGIGKQVVQAQVTEAARILGLETLLERKPRQLSGGQRQRVALGRAIVRHPQVFLLDEPLSNLDAELRTQTRVELMRLHERLETTFVYVTHDQVEAMTMGTRIAVMRAGRLQQVAAPREIYSQPANMYVAGFIGSPRINFVPVVCDGRTARAAGFTVELPRSIDVRDAQLGIRPEWFSEQTGDAKLVVDLDVEVVEVLGADQYLYGHVATTPITARVGPSVRVASGDRLSLAVDVSQHLLFDSSTELAIGL